MADVQNQVRVEFASLTEIKREVGETRLAHNERAQWQQYLDALRSRQQEALRVTLTDNTPQRRLTLRRSIHAAARDMQFPVTVRKTSTGLAVWPQSPEEAAEGRKRYETMKTGRNTRKTIAQAIAAQPPVVAEVPSEVVEPPAPRRRRR